MLPCTKRSINGQTQPNPTRNGGGPKRKVQLKFALAPTPCPHVIYFDYGPQRHPLWLAATQSQASRKEQNSRDFCFTDLSGTPFVELWGFLNVAGPDNMRETATSLLFFTNTHTPENVRGFCPFWFSLALLRQATWGTICQLQQSTFMCPYSSARVY